VSWRASGLHAWVLQRVSAVVLAVFSVLLLTMLLLSPPASFSDWRDWVTTPWVSIGFSLYIVAVLLHAWVGIRDVLIDYVHPLGLRLLLLSLFGLLFIGSGIWSLQAILLAHLIQ
jgi:succinate dehydrogenase / fumarate reductase membrane anchor subunit